MVAGSKSASAFRTISEASKELDLPQHVLRFWETKFNQIRPLKRGGGRRYYRPEDVETLRQIRGLLYDNGYTIKGVQKLLKDGAINPESSNETLQGTKTPVNTADNALPQNTNDALHTILNELQEIQGILRNWA